MLYFSPLFSETPIFAPNTFPGFPPGWPAEVHSRGRQDQRLRPKPSKLEPSTRSSLPHPHSYYRGLNNYNALGFTGPCAKWYILWPSSKLSSPCMRCFGSQCRTPRSRARGQDFCTGHSNPKEQNPELKGLHAKTSIQRQFQVRRCALTEGSHEADKTIVSDYEA